MSNLLIKNETREGNWRCPHCSAVDMIGITEIGETWAKVWLDDCGNVLDYSSIGENVQEARYWCRNCDGALELPEEDE